MNDDNPIPIRPRPPTVPTERMLRRWQEANLTCGAADYAVVTDQASDVCADCSLQFETGEILFQYGAQPLPLPGVVQDEDVAIRRKHEYRCGPCAQKVLIQGQRFSGAGVHIEKRHLNVSLEDLPDAVQARTIQSLGMLDRLFENLDRAAQAAMAAKAESSGEPS